MWLFLLRVWRLLRAEIIFGFLIATVFWAAILGWQAAYAPTDSEKQKCHEAAERSGHKSEECKSLWERTTSDPVAFFTFWLVISTIGLGVSTVMLWRAGERQFRHARRSAIIQSRDMQASIAAARDAADASLKASKNSEEIFRKFEIPRLYPVNLKYSATAIDAAFSISFKNYGRYPATLREAWIAIAITRPENPSPTLFRTSRIPFMVEGMIGDKETCETFVAGIQLWTEN